MNQGYEVSQSSDQALMKFERLLLRVSVFPLTNLLSKITFPMGLHAMVETTMQSDAENLYSVTTSSYRLQQPLHPTYTATLLQHFAGASPREGSQHFCCWIREAKHRVLPHFRSGIKNGGLTSFIVAV